MKIQKQDNLYNNEEILDTQSKRRKYRNRHNLPSFVEIQTVVV